MATLGSYDPSSSSGLNRARRALSDTGASRTWVFSDVEIGDWISDRGSWQGAVAEGFRTLAGRVARDAQDYSNEQGSVTQTSNYDLLNQQAKEWDVRAAAATAQTESSTMPRAIVGSLGRAPSDPTYQRNP